jgi:hypothetical protein
MQKKQFLHLLPRHAEAKVASVELIAGAAYAVCLMEVDRWLAEHTRQENCFVVVEDHRETRLFVKAHARACGSLRIAREFALQLED